VITVVGLLLFLRSGGIEAAALISSIAYATTCVITTSLFVHRAQLPPRVLFGVLPTWRVAALRMLELLRGRGPAAVAAAREGAGR
jgi:hypothetical protein